MTLQRSEFKGAAPRCAAHFKCSRNTRSSAAAHVLGYSNLIFTFTIICKAFMAGFRDHSATHPFIASPRGINVKLQCALNPQKL